MSWRPDLAVMARFLDRLAQRRDWTYSSLQRACGVNYDVLRRYLDFLAERDLVEVDGRDVRLTEAGSAWRDRLVTWLSELFGDVP